MKAAITSACLALLIVDSFSWAIATADRPLPACAKECRKDPACGLSVKDLCTGECYGACLKNACDSEADRSSLLKACTPSYKTASDISIVVTDITETVTVTPTPKQPKTASFSEKDDDKEDPDDSGQQLFSIYDPTGNSGEGSEVEADGSRKLAAGATAEPESSESALTSTGSLDPMSTSATSSQNGTSAGVLGHKPEDLPPTVIAVAIGLVGLAWILP